MAGGGRHDWGRSGWPSNWSRGGNRWSDSSGRGGRRLWYQVADSAAGPQVADSAASSRSVWPRVQSSEEDFAPPGWNRFDTQNVQGLGEQEQREAKIVSKRTAKLGKAFQNYRRAILHLFWGMMVKNRFFEAWWHKTHPTHRRALAYLMFTDDDMEHFLNTVASFKEHKDRWHKKLCQRTYDRTHADFGKTMPRMIPANLVRLNQVILAQTHRMKRLQYFGSAEIEGTLHTPIQVLAEKRMWLYQLPCRLTSRSICSSWTPTMPWPTRSMKWRN